MTPFWSIPSLLYYPNADQANQYEFALPASYKKTVLNLTMKISS